MRITPPAISIARGVPNLVTIRKLMLELLCCGTDPPHQNQNRSIYKSTRRQTITPAQAERERLPPELKIATSTCEIRNSTYTQAVRHAFLRCTLVRPPIRSHHHKFLARRPPACRFRAPGGSRSQAQLLTHRTQHRPKLSPMQSDHLTPEMQRMTATCAIRELGTGVPHAGDQHADHTACHQHCERRTSP